MYRPPAASQLHLTASPPQVLHSNYEVTGMYLTCTKPVPLLGLCMGLFPQLLCPQILMGKTHYLLQFRFQLKGHLFREAFCDHQFNPKKFPSRPPAVFFRSKAAGPPLHTCLYHYLVKAHLCTTSPQTQNSAETKECSNIFQGLNE